MKTKVLAKDNCVTVRLGGKEVWKQNCEPTNRKAISGRVRGASWHKTAKPSGSAHTVNGPVVQRKFMFLSGEISVTSVHSGSALSGNRPGLDAVLPGKFRDQVARNQFTDPTKYGRV